MEIWAYADDIKVACDARTGAFVMESLETNLRESGLNLALNRTQILCDPDQAEFVEGPLAEVLHAQGQLVWDGSNGQLRN